MEIIKNIEEEQVLFIVNFLEDEDEVKNIKDEKIDFVIHPTCYFCSKTFKSELELDLHKKKSPECDLLVESTRANDQNRPSERVKTYNKMHKCGICKQTCSTASDLKFHMKSHLILDQPLVPQCFICKICKKPIIGIDSMNRHKRRHLEVKSYKCDHCPRAFNCASLLTVHSRGLFNLISNFNFFFKIIFEILVHTGEKPFGCKYCDKTFSAKSNCVAHEIRHYGFAKKFCCPFPNCDKQFQQKTGLAYHVAKSHDKNYIIG